MGEDFDVNVTVKNTGDDGGALTVSIRQNGTELAQHRVVVESDNSKQFTETIQFDEPGKYVIRTDNRKLGTVRVQRASSAVVNETADRRTVQVRAGSVPTTEPYELQFPNVSNRSLAVESWAVEASQAQFTQRVTEFTDPEASEAQLPSGTSVSVVGVVTVGSTAGVDAVTMRVAVDRSRLREAGLKPNSVGIYHQNGSTWEPLNTTTVEERADTVVYEARATDFSTFAVGSIESEFTVEDTSLGTTQVESGQRIVLEAVVRNDGSVAGDYDGAMVVDGERVNETTVSIPAESERPVRLSHDVDSAGTYEIALNDDDAGSIVITEGQVTDDTPSTTETGPTDSQSTPEESPATGDGPDISLPAGVPATVMGIDTVYLGGGIGVALVVFFGLVLLLRRGGGDNNGGGFDQL